MRNIIALFKRRIQEFKNDRRLLIILLLHLLLILCHFCQNKMDDIQYFWYLRAAGCGVIAILIFFFGRIGLSYGLTVFACALIYINNFYNYGSIFFILTAMGAYPKRQIPICIVFLINVVISFSLKKFIVISFIIQFIYAVLFYLLITYCFNVKPATVLNLKDDERYILSELAKGKLQKEIDGYSEQTISQKLKLARERNMCEKTEDLVNKYKEENNL